MNRLDILALSIVAAVTIAGLIYEPLLVLFIFIGVAFIWACFWLMNKYAVWKWKI